LQLEHKGHTFLFTGDIKSGAIEKLNGEERDDDFDETAVFESADVVKLPHHGTDTSYNEYMIEQIEYTAVISNNDDATPTASSPGQDMLNELRDEDVMTYWTATHEDIVFIVDEQGRLGVVREDEDGDDLETEVPPIADDLLDELPSVRDALGPHTPGLFSAGSGASAGAGT